MLCEPEKLYIAQQVLNHIWIIKNALNSKGNIINLNFKHLKKIYILIKYKKQFWFLSLQDYMKMK